jgi:hypothetical protein
MKILTCALLLAMSSPLAADEDAPNVLSESDREEGWQLLFDGKSLDGWRASDAPGTFSVRDGTIVVHGPRSHLFYVGPVQEHEFRNFELAIEVRTLPKANSGVYFHTRWQEQGWPEQGYEVQVNNSHTDTSRSGGLWGVRDFREKLAEDREWFRLNIIVDGKHVITTIDGETVVDYTEEDNPQRPPDIAKRLIGSGTFALQGHDPQSEVHYRNIKVRTLP